MQRRVLVGAAAAAAAVLAIGMLVLASQQGLFGGKAQRLLAQAAKAEQRGNLPEAQGLLEELIATFPDSPWTDDALLKLGGVYEAQQQFVEARAMYRMLVDQFPESPLLPSTQERLGQVNVSLLFSPIITDTDVVHAVKPGETLGKIASNYGTTVEYLVRSNGLKNSIIRPEQKLKIPRGTFGIVVDKSQNQLLLTADDQFVKLYEVSTGKENSTPVGTFKIVSRIPDPVWYTQGAVVPPDSPENVLGSRWMGINQKGYGIHGTIEPDAIGKQVTAGCVRMINADVEELIEIVPIGTEVTIVD
jgi:lipoprotein-anchoring transpeptidase ErfK/SrfK